MRSRQRRPQTHSGKRHGIGIPRKLLERRAQLFEIVDDAFHRQPRGVADLTCRDIDDAALGQQPRRLTGVVALLIKNEPRD